MGGVLGPRPSRRPGDRKGLVMGSEAVSSSGIKISSVTTYRCELSMIRNEFVFSNARSTSPPSLGEPPKSSYGSAARISGESKPLQKTNGCQCPKLLLSLFSWRPSPFVFPYALTQLHQPVRPCQGNNHHSLACSSNIAQSSRHRLPGDWPAVDGKQLEIVSEAHALLRSP